MNTILESRHEASAGGAGNNLAMSHNPVSQTWMVSFADLMAILLTFMVISFSTKEINDASWQQMSQSMLEVFEATTLSEVPTLAIGRSGAGARDASDQVVAELIIDRFPELGSEGGVELASQGVEVDLTKNPGEGETADTVTRYLASLDRDMLVKVEASLSGQSPGSVQRTLAWENGLMAAMELRSRLQEQGLSTQPDVEVTMTLGGDRTLLVVKSAGRAGR